MKKIFGILVLMIICIAVLTQSCNALTFLEMQSKADKFISEGEENSHIEEGDTNELVNGLANILTTIGVVVVLAGLLIIGIRYMVASPEEAAKLKVRLVGLVIAGVVILCAFEIWTLAGQFFKVSENAKYTSADSSKETASAELKSITIYQKTKTIRVNETYQINVHKLPTNAKNVTISYESTNDEIASVDENGLVTRKV